MEKHRHIKKRLDLEPSNFWCQRCLYEHEEHTPSDILYWDEHIQKMIPLCDDCLCEISDEQGKDFFNFSEN